MSKYKKFKRKSPKATPAAKSSAVSTPGCTVTNKSIKLDPDAALLLAITAFHKNRWSEVIETAHQVVVVLPNMSESLASYWAQLTAEAHFRQAMDFFQKKRHRAVLAELTKACTYMPTDSTYLYHLGLAQHRLGYWSKALDIYERAWQSKPSWRIAYHQALAALQNGEHISEDKWFAYVERLETTASKNAQSSRAINRLTSWWACSSGHNLAGKLPEWLSAPRLPMTIKLEVALFYLAANDYKAAATIMAKVWKAARKNDNTNTQLTTALKYIIVGALIMTEVLADKRKTAVDLLYDEWLTSSIDNNNSAVDQFLLNECLSFFTLAIWHAGWHFWQNGDYTNAIDIWEDALEYVPACPDLMRNCALGYERIDYHEEAVVLWERYAQTAKANNKSAAATYRQWNEQMIVQAYVHMCKYTFINDIKGEYQWFNEIMYSKWFDTEDRLELAKLTALASEFSLVRTLVHPICSLADANPDILRQLARIYHDAKLLQEEQDTLEKLLQISPDDKEACTLLADILYKKALAALEFVGNRQYKQALPLLLKASQLYPDDERIWAALAVYYYRHGDTAEAEKYVDYVLNFNNDLQPADHMAAIGDLLLHIGLNEQGEYYLNKSLKCDPTPNTRAAIALSHLQHNMQTIGMREMKRAFKEWQYDLNSCLSIIAKLMQSDKTSAVQTLARLLIKYHDDSSWLHISMAALYINSGILDKARQHLKKAKKISQAENDAESLRKIDELEHTIDFYMYNELPQKRLKGK